jgi:hypothetical protein
LLDWRDRVPPTLLHQDDQSAGLLAGLIAGLIAGLRQADRRRGGNPVILKRLTTRGLAERIAVTGLLGQLLKLLIRDTKFRRDKLFVGYSTIRPHGIEERMLKDDSVLRSTATIDQNGEPIGMMIAPKVGKIAQVNRGREDSHDLPARSAVGVDRCRNANFPEPRRRAAKGGGEMGLMDRRDGGGCLLVRIMSWGQALQVGGTSVKVSAIGVIPANRFARLVMVISIGQHTTVAIDTEKAGQFRLISVAFELV